MRHYMIGISGFSGTGKDTISDELVRGFEATRIGLADPAKRHMADLYGFTEEQLFGPSMKRNAGDLRYPKKGSMTRVTESYKFGDTLINTAGVSKPIELDRSKNYYYFVCPDSHDNIPYENVMGDRRIFYVEEGNPDFWLSPRETLQKYCELMNSMYLDTWIRKSLETQIKLASEWPNYAYSNMEGLIECSYYSIVPPKGEYIVTCSPDFRHKHEVKLSREYGINDTTSILIRVTRPSIPKPPFQHRSEIEQTTIPDSAFDFVLNNDGSVQDLCVKTDIVMERILGSGRPQSVVYL